MNENWERIILETSVPPVSPQLVQLALDDLRRARGFLEAAAHDPQLSRAREIIEARLRGGAPAHSTPLPGDC